MILSLYLKDIVYNYTNEKYDLITIELPIANLNNNYRSNNIDYLMVNENKNNALLIELKSEQVGNKNKFSHQIDKYKYLKNNNIKENVNKIINAERKIIHRIKYKKLSELISDNLDNIKNIDIMYIAPDIIIQNELKQKYTDFIKYKIGFSELIKLKFDDNWEIIKKYIIELNK
jgi:hypothetical protein